MAFDLPSSGSVSLAVYDVAGRLVRSLVDDWRPAGRHVANWDGQTRNGTTAPAGVYFARLTGSEGTVTRRIVLVR
jgi:flagellar hook assembly protein FlgD